MVKIKVENILIKTVFIQAMKIYQLYINLIL